MSSSTPRQERSAAYSSEYVIPTLCRNLRSLGVSIVTAATGRSAASVKQSRQQSERGFTMDTFLRHRGQRHSITSSCVDERPTPNMCFGTPPHLQVNGSLRYSTLSILFTLVRFASGIPDQHGRRGRCSFGLFHQADTRTTSALVTVDG